MLFERSFDYPLLSKLLRDPRLYPFLSDDFSPPLAEVQAAEHPDLIYLLTWDEVELLGFFLFEPRTSILYEIHATLPLDRRALAALRALVGPAGWLWTNTPCQRVRAVVPEWNRIVLRFAYRAGFTECGREPRAIQKGGALQAQILLGIGRPEET